MLRVGFDATAAAQARPTGVGLAVGQQAGSLRLQSAAGALELDVLYRWTRLARRRCFLPGPYRLFDDRLGVVARRVDVFHGADTRLPTFVGPAFVATIHDLSARRPGFASAAFRHTRERHWERVRGRADLVVTYTDAIRRELVDELGLAAERIAVVPLAPNAALRPLSTAEARAAVARIVGARPYLLALGELSLRKNTARAVEALAAAGQALERLVLVLAGPSGQGSEEVDAAVGRLGLSGRVIRASYLPAHEVACLLSQATALVFPSRYEGFGMPVLEAFRAGVPVVASTAAAVLEVAGGAALHADADDVEGLAGHLVRVANDAPLRADLVARGLTRVGAFSWERTARSLVAVYQAAYARGAAPLTAES